MNLFRGGGLKLGNLVTKTLEFSNLEQGTDKNVTLIDTKAIIYSALIKMTTHPSGSSKGYSFSITLNDLSEWSNGTETLGINRSSSDIETYIFEILGPGFLSDIKSINQCSIQRTANITDSSTNCVFSNNKPVIIGKLEDGGRLTILTKNIFNELNLNLQVPTKGDDIRLNFKLALSYYPILN